jgi:hypothetical protein
MRCKPWPASSVLGLETRALFFPLLSPQYTYTSLRPIMSMLDKFRRGAQKAGVQATAFIKDSGTKISSESRDFVQGFSLPGEAEKAAKILTSFLGMSELMLFTMFLHLPLSSTSRP